MPYGKVAVDFIGDHQDMIVNTDAADTLQLLPRPYPSTGIVRRAQNQQLCIRFCRLLCKVLEINPVGIPLLNQGVVHQNPVMTGGGGIHGIVHRRHEHHTLAGFCKRLNRREKGIDDTRRIPDPLRLDLPAMTARLPGNHCLSVFLRHGRIAHYAAVEERLQSLPHLRHHIKFHIRHREGDYILREAAKSPLDFIPFAAPGILSSDYCLKIVPHCTNTSPFHPVYCRL